MHKFLYTSDSNNSLGMCFKTSRRSRINGGILSSSKLKGKNSPSLVIDSGGISISSGRTKRSMAYEPAVGVTFFGAAAAANLETLKKEFTRDILPIKFLKKYGMYFLLRQQRFWWVENFSSKSMIEWNSTLETDFRVSFGLFWCHLLIDKTQISVSD